MRWVQRTCRPGGDRFGAAVKRTERISCLVPIRLFQVSPAMQAVPLAVLAPAYLRSSEFNEMEGQRGSLVARSNRTITCWFVAQAVAPAALARR
jgi:hypothetical protein